MRPLNPQESPDPSRSAVQLRTRGEPGYPTRLDDLAAPPPFLWQAGDWQPGGRACAVVGARAASKRSLDLARELAIALARRSIDVISGGAIGVDTAAHEGALLGGGQTVAVLGTGIDVTYPERNRRLFDDIRRRGGALVTQFAPTSAPRRGSFPVRNQIIAALSDAVVVVEASLLSGSLHTARAARELGRTLVAVIGSPGTDALVVAGAKAAASVDDVLALWEGRAVPPPPTPADPDAARLYAALDGVPRDVGDLAFRAGLAIGTCTAAVIDLELDGLAARTSGGRYLRLR